MEVFCNLFYYQLSNLFIIYSLPAKTLVEAIRLSDSKKTSKRTQRPALQYNFLICLLLFLHTQLASSQRRSPKSFWGHCPSFPIACHFPLQSCREEALLPFWSTAAKHFITPGEDYSNLYTGSQFQKHYTSTHWDNPQLAFMCWPCSRVVHLQLNRWVCNLTEHLTNVFCTDAN